MHSNLKSLLVEAEDVEIEVEADEVEVEFCPQTTNRIAPEQQE